MTDDKPTSNLPPNPPPVPNVPLVKNSPADPVTLTRQPSNAPTPERVERFEPTVPPPMPVLSGFYTTPIQSVSQDSVVSMIKDFLKNNVTVAGQPADVSGGKMDFPAPTSKVTSGSMGVSIATPVVSNPPAPVSVPATAILPLVTAPVAEAKTPTSGTPSNEVKQPAASSSEVKSPPPVSPTEVKPTETNSLETTFKPTGSTKSPTEEKTPETPAPKSGGHIVPLPSTLKLDHLSAPVESTADYRKRTALERTTSIDFSEYIHSDAHPMSKTDTIKAIADQMQKDSGGTLSSKEAKTQATKVYEARMEENASHASNMSDKEYETKKARLADQYRHNGESSEDFRARLHENSKINAIADPERRKQALEDYTLRGLGNKYVPIRLTRADGRQMLLAAFESVANFSATNGVPREADEYYDTYTHPFKVLVKTSSLNSPDTQAGVVYYSHLFKSLKPGDVQPITGLLSLSNGLSPEYSSSSSRQGIQQNQSQGSSLQYPPRNPTGVMGWVSVNNGDYVYLEIGIDNGSVTSADIYADSTIPGDAWTPGGYVENDGASPPSQTYARIVLAKIVEGFAVQYVTTNLVLKTMCINGRSALYPTPC